MSQKQFSIRIASVSDKEKLTAEISYDNDLWAIVSHEQKDYVVIFFSCLTEKYWEFFLDDALAVLEQAKKMLSD